MGVAKFVAKKCAHDNFFCGQKSQKFTPSRNTRYRET
jgi:hypothetical protein